MSWAGYAAVIAAFFLTHSVPMRPAVKSQVTARLGTRGFGLLYSVLSVMMLSLLIWAAGQAPFVQIWPQLHWHRHAAHIGMLLVCVILALSVARPNPFSFGGVRNSHYDPAHPGITRLTRHPILVALALWAAVHLLPNGDLAHVILFGLLGGFAVAGRWLIDTRKRRDMGQGRWHALNTARQSAPWFQAPQSWGAVGQRLGCGLIAFVVIAWAHPYVIGVAVF
ncbi:MAG: NnrU family protein [Roseovarius sp.]